MKNIKEKFIEKYQSKKQFKQAKNQIRKPEKNYSHSSNQDLQITIFQ